MERKIYKDRICKEERLNPLEPSFGVFLLLGSVEVMAEEYTEGLLKKTYYENCPGCKVDQLKELKRGLPIRELFSIWIVVLCTGDY